MKALFTVIVSTIFSFSLLAQGSYEEALGNALTKFGTASSTSEFQAAAAQFERIAEVEAEEWLPPYYASLIYCIIAFQTEDVEQKELFVDQAQKQADMALKVAPKESEVHTLQGMIYQAYIGIDPMANGQVYSAKANGSFQMAMKLNEANPRPLYLQATSVMYTPEQFGGGKAAALPMFEEAMKLFKAFKPTGPMHPDWGVEDCENNLAACKEGV